MNRATQNVKKRRPIKKGQSG